jgi:hypothetical protein
MYWTARDRPVPCRLVPTLAGWAGLDERVSAPGVKQDHPIQIDPEYRINPVVPGSSPSLGSPGWPMPRERRTPRTTGCSSRSCGSTANAFPVLATLLLGLLPGPAELLVAASVLAGAVRGVFTLTEATLVTGYWGPGRYAAVNGVFNAPLTAAGAIAPGIRRAARPAAPGSGGSGSSPTPRAFGAGPADGAGTGSQVHSAAGRSLPAGACRGRTKSAGSAW